MLSRSSKVGSLKPALKITSKGAEKIVCYKKEPNKRNKNENINKPQRSWWIRIIKWESPSRVANINLHHRQSKKNNIGDDDKISQK